MITVVQYNAVEQVINFTWAIRQDEDFGFDFLFGVGFVAFDLVTMGYE